MIGLMEKARNGSVEAFLQLFQAHEATLYRISYMLAGDEKAALEAMQESACRSYKEINQLKVAGNFKNWVVGKTIHCAQDCHGSGRSTKGKGDDKPTVSPLLENAIHRLSVEEMTALILFSYLGYSCKEAAYFMGIPEPDAKELYGKAMESLGMGGIADAEGHERLIKQEINKIEIPTTLHRRAANAVSHIAKKMERKQATLQTGSKIWETLALIACFAFICVGLYVGSVGAVKVEGLGEEEKSYLEAIMLLNDYLEYGDYKVTDITHTRTGNTVNILVYTSFDSEDTDDGKYIERAVRSFLEVDQVARIADVRYAITVYSSDMVVIN